MKYRRNLSIIRDKSCDPHGPLELVADDGEVATVLHLCVNHLSDDLFVLAVVPGAPETQCTRSGVRGKVTAI